MIRTRFRRSIISVVNQWAWKGQWLFYWITSSEITKNGYRGAEFKFAVTATGHRERISRTYCRKVQTLIRR